MDFSGLITTLVIVGILGIVVGLFLSVAAIIFKVEVDEKEEAVLNALPGNNCGGCGYPGCAGLASAISKKDAPVNQCPVGGESVAKAIAEIMGTTALESEKLVAFVACKATCDDFNKDYNYYGIEDCRMLSFVPNGGPKSCNNGCLGFGTCVSVCPFDAIHVENGVAKVDRNKCKACGKCVDACPKNLISLIPFNSQYAVSCSNTDKGPVANKICKSSCIGCGICVKNCEHEAVKVSNLNATIDTSKCVNCGTCETKCPKKVIVKQYET